jgi:RNA polymerase sigma-70 factor, ECF subfamily
MRSDLEQTYRDLRPYAFAIAYRMLGSVSEAEDIVQEMFLRMGQDDDAEIRSPKAYVATVTSRLAIDHLRSARTRRESYFGPWLPEPVVDETVAGSGTDVIGTVELAESLSMAFLVVLESLNPVERAVFLLHDIFGFEYGEIAAMVDKSEANCRQVASRARKRVQDERPRFDSSREQRDALAARFFDACQGRDLTGLVSMLAEDAAFYGDGGTKGTGLNRPIYGRDNLLAVLDTLFRQGERLGIVGELVTVNGQPGAMFFDQEHRLINVISLDIFDGVVQSVRSVVNPEKLTHLGPLSPIGRRGQSPDWSDAPVD